MATILLSMSNTETTKRHYTRNAAKDALVRLMSARKASVAQIETNSMHMGRLEKAGLVKVVGKVKTGNKGRPAHVYSITDAGRQVAKAHRKAQAKSAA